MRASPAEHQVYVWNPAGARQKVELRVDVAQRIGEWARAGLETEGRGIENGGLLLGRTRRERGRTVVEIFDAEPVECEHAAGPSWMLSNTDRRAMDGQIRSHRSAVVGCYRSNTRREFTATVEDFGLLESHFPLMLLVDTRRGAPLQAAFVFRGDREMQASFPFSPEGMEVVDANPAPVAEAPVLPAIPPPVAETEPAAPRPMRIPKAAWAAAAVVLGVTAGVWYDGTTRSPRPVEAKKSEPVARVEAPVVEPPPAPETPAAEPEAAPAETAEAAPEPVAPAPRKPAPTPAPAPIVSADRAVPPPAPARPARRDFVPPKVGRAATARVDSVDLPVVEAPRTAAPTIVAGGSAPRPVTPAPPVADSRVAVAVDAVPVRGARFVPPETIHPATPRSVHVDRAVVINVKVYLDRSGNVNYAELLSDGTGANRDLASAAVFSARKWRFSPAKVDGRAVPAQAVLRFRFEPETR